MVSELEEDLSSDMAAGDWWENHLHDPACNEMTSCQPCKISQKPHPGRTPREHVHYNKEQDPKFRHVNFYRKLTHGNRSRASPSSIFEKWHNLTATESSGDTVLRILTLQFSYLGNSLRCYAFEQTRDQQVRWPVSPRGFDTLQKENLGRGTCIPTRGRLFAAINLKACPERTNLVTRFLPYLFFRSLSNFRAH